MDSKCLVKKSIVLYDKSYGNREKSYLKIPLKYWSLTMSYCLEKEFMNLRGQSASYPVQRRYMRRTWARLFFLPSHTFQNLSWWEWNNFKLSITYFLDRNIRRTNCESEISYGRLLYRKWKTMLLFWQRSDICVYPQLERIPIHRFRGAVSIGHKQRSCC